MKRFIMSMLTAAAILFSGCTETVNETTVSATAYACGLIAGGATELSKTKTSVKEGIAAVLEIAESVAPEGEKTFLETWTPIVEDSVKRLVEDKKLEEGGGEFVRKCSLTVASGIDFLFERHPDWKNYKNFVSVAVHSFVEGYKSVMLVSATPETSKDKTEGAIKEDLEVYGKLFAKAE